MRPVYEGRCVDPDAVWAAIATTIKAHDAEIEAWLDSAPQTNEVGRSAALMAGLLYLADRFGLPSCELLEIGSSAGLNLLMPRFAFDLGGVSAGDAQSSLTIAPSWRGGPPPAGSLEIRIARGVDISPIDVRDAAQAARLVAYVWPEHAERLDRLSKAIAIAREHPPRVDRQHAADWLKAQLALPQDAGAMRVVMHSVVWQYLNPDQRRSIETTMADHASCATAASPLAWLAFELDPELGGYSLTARGWPGQGAVTRLAKVHAHGRSVEWFV